jgi:hypothetical protein
MPRCKNCKDKFEPIRFNHKYCLKDECIRAFVAETKEKMWKQTKVRMKNELKTTSDWMKEAQKVFNQYIRLRDKHKACVSCESKLGSKYDAGHYFSSGGHKAVTFDEDNVHGQCVACNQYKHGNLLNYQIGIEKRIGAERLLQLHEKAHQTRKYSADELQEIIKTYKKKIKNGIQQ